MVASTPLWTRRQTAQFLNLKEQTLAMWAMVGRGPRFIKVGRAVRYRPQDVERYLQANTVGSQSDE